MSHSEPATADPTGTGNVPPSQAKHPLAHLVGMTKDAVLAILLVLFILVFLFRPFRVEGVSMAPQLADHERIIVSRLSYQVSPIARGDVVVFWYPEDPSKSFVKRVLGLPGDLVEIKAGVVHINGEPMAEPYIAQAYRLPENRPAVLVRPGYYYVLGDHRSRSFDSRSWGLVPERYIYGKAVFSYWPLQRFGRLP